MSNPHKSRQSGGGSIDREQELPDVVDAPPPEHSLPQELKMSVPALVAACHAPGTCVQSCRPIPPGMATDPNLNDADVRLWLRIAAVPQISERELRERRDSVARLVEHGYLEVTDTQVRLLEGRAAA